MSNQLSRRALLRAASLAGLAACLPALGPLPREVSRTRCLVLLELTGGNDGLNTIVPYEDPVYLARRGKYLRLTPGNADYTRGVIPFSTFSGSSALAKPAGLGVHASLGRLQDAWQAGDLAVVQGVGYPNPNRSHFRGIDIWHSGCTDDQPVLASGWLGRMFRNEGLSPAAAVDGIHFSRANETPLRAAQVKALSIGTPSDFLKKTEALIDPSDSQLATTNPALAHVLGMQRIAKRARSTLVSAIGTPLTFTTAFPANGLGNQLKYVAQCIAGGLENPFYKVSLGGFDNHTNQPAKHADLLAQVADGLAALRSALIERGRWDDVLVMTYSEFGRRVEENESQGTDHGTAAPHLVLGGRVIGGLHGTAPALSDLDRRGDLKATVDFRRLHATAGRWLGIAGANIDAGLDPFATSAVFAPIDCVEV